MSEEIVPQEEQEVKKCEVEWCDEDAERDGLCWFHFCEEKIAEWAAEEPEKEECIFGDAAVIDDAWWGYDPKEVLA